MDPHRLGQWRKDIINLSNQLVGLHERQAVWREYARRFRQAPPGREEVVHDWIIANYSDAMAIGIRRLIFPAKGGSVSMVGLLESILKHAGTFAFDDALSVWGQGHDEGIARHRKWLLKRFFPAEGAAAISRSRIGQDLAQLQEYQHVVRIKAWADNRIAHAVLHEPIEAVPFDDIERALAVLAHQVHDYGVLLVNSSNATFEPVFTTPWTASLDRLFGVQPSTAGGRSPGK